MSKISKSNQIEKIVFGGMGLTRIEGCVTFVPFTASGDVVDLKITTQKKHYQRAEVIHLEQSGPDRVIPRCPHFTHCGGCQLQHLSYSGQLHAKQQFIQEALKLDTVPITPAPHPWNYRSHIRLNLRKVGKGFKMGFIGLDNHSLVEPLTCPIFQDNPAFFVALKEGLIKLPNEGIESASLRLFYHQERFVLAFSSFPKLPRELLAFPFAAGVAYKAPGKEKHLGNTSLETEVLDVRIPFSPYGFMQNNIPVSEDIYQMILEWAQKGKKRILDLYCGAGVTTTLLTRQGHEVIGVEANSALISPYSEGRIICNTVEQVLPQLLKEFAPDLILVNPPKTGLSKEVRLLLEKREMIYLSCMPATLARDIGNCSIEKIHAFDMFPQTTHVETLVKYLFH